MTSNPENILVPVPNYDGICLASVDSSNYRPATQSLMVQNYTQCQSYSRSPNSAFSVGSNATVDIVHTRSGPLGYVSITKYQVTPNEYTSLDDFGGEISKGSASQLFYQSVCTNTGAVNMFLNDAGTLSLTSSTNCALYDNEESFKPFTQFNELYWIDAQGTYSFTTFVQPTAPGNAGGVLNFLDVQICLASNYIVLDPLPSTFTPSSTLAFTVYLGLTQSMSTKGEAKLTCGAEVTTQTFTLTNNPIQQTINTPDVPEGNSCSLYVYNAPEADAYAAPVQVTITAFVSSELTISVPSNVVLATNLLAYSVYADSDPSVSTSVVMEMYCGSTLVGTQSTTSSTSTQYFPVPNAAIGVCQFNTTDSNTVEVIVQQQLSIASSLNGWISGYTVVVNITSPNLEAELITLSTSCSIGGFSQQVTTSSNANYFISDGTNGVQCLLSTSNLPQYYLPIPLTLVNIGLDPQQQQSIIQSLQLPLFIDNLVRDRDLQDLQKSAEIKSIRRFLKLKK